MKTEIEPYYQTQAKQIIDSMFDCKVFNEKFTRNDMQGFEDLIAFHFQSHARTAKKCAEFTNSLKHLK
jgi:hypothetical protein